MTFDVNREPEFRQNFYLFLRECSVWLVCYLVYIPEMILIYILNYRCKNDNIDDTDS